MRGSPWIDLMGSIIVHIDCAHHQLPRMTGETWAANPVARMTEVAHSHSSPARFPRANTASDQEPGRTGTEPRIRGSRSSGLSAVLAARNSGSPGLVLGSFGRPAACSIGAGFEMVIAGHSCGCFEEERKERKPPLPPMSSARPWTMISNSEMRLMDENLSGEARRSHTTIGYKQ